MKVTVTEALRIKNLVSQKVQVIQTQFRNVQHGITTEENGTVVGQSDGVKLTNYLDALRAIYRISEQINSLLSRFNVETGIADNVRAKANLLTIQNYLEQSIEVCATKKTTSYVNLGQQRVAVTQIFSPFTTKAELKSQLKEVKKSIRELQTKIDFQNATLIELPFSYEDLDSISVD